ncbi:MAG TPA: tetratricopeptide repeat protein, partial [Micromonosporaceae bacterium]
MGNSPLIASLTAAVDAAPEDLPLRVHLADLLLRDERRAEAIGQLAQVLARDPAHAEAQALMASAIAGAAPGAGAPDRDTPTNATTRPTAETTTAETATAETATDGAATAGAATAASATPEPASPEKPESSERAEPIDVSAHEPTTPGAEAATSATADADGDQAGPPASEVPPDLADEPEPPAEDVDWGAFEDEFAGIVPPRFAAAADEAEPVAGESDRMFDVETSSVFLADVHGMDDVKKRLEVAFLGPLRNPKLRGLYAKSLRGGLMLYGPPGCGKTFIARAVAGEMGAKFISLSIVDVLNMYVGNSEQNLHQIFEAARRNAPCVLFLDEIDALGHKRSAVNSSTMRTLGNQLLAELDGLDGNNEGVFVLAATNAPWDVDPALRRPGRFDRVILVLPPDRGARGPILQYHLRERPVANIDLRKIVSATEDFSGADLAHLCDSAAEQAMYDSIATGEVRM